MGKNSIINKVSGFVELELRPVHGGRRHQLVDELFPLRPAVVGGIRDLNPVDDVLRCPRDPPRGSVLPGIAGILHNKRVSEARQDPAIRQENRSKFSVCDG